MSTYTAEEIRSRREGAYSWYGYVADDSVEHITQRIENLLTGRRYTFVSTNVEHKNAAPEVRTSQRLTPEKTDSKKSPRVVRIGDKQAWTHTPSTICGVSAADTYGSWGFYSGHATEDDAVADARSKDKAHLATYVLIEGGRTPEDVGSRSRIEVVQYNGYGEVLQWVIAPEATPDLVDLQDDPFVEAVAQRWFDQDPEGWREDGADSPNDLLKTVGQVLRCAAEQIEATP